MSPIGIVTATAFALLFAVAKMSALFFWVPLVTRLGHGAKNCDTGPFTRLRIGI